MGRRVLSHGSFGADRRVRIRVAVVAAAIASIGLVGMGLIGASEPSGYDGPDTRTLQEEGSGDLVAGSTAIVRTLSDQARGVDWTIYEYATSSYPECHDAVAFASGTGDYLGFVGGCGSKNALNRDPYYYAGWVQSPDGGRAYLTYGFVPLSRRALLDRVTWERAGEPGTRVSDRTVEGVWAFVTASPDAAKVRLLDPARNVIAAHNIPNLEDDQS